MSHTSLILGTNWEINEWPEYVRVIHEEHALNAFFFLDRVYVPKRTCRIKPWHMEEDTGFYDCLECECGHVMDVSEWAKSNYCPYCGAEVVE